MFTRNHHFLPETSSLQSTFLPESSSESESPHTSHKFLAMSSNGQKEATPNGSKNPTNITDQVTSLKRKRFRRIKSAPLSDSLTSDAKSTDSKNPDASKSSPKSVFDHLYPNYWKVAVILFVYLAAGTLIFDLARHQISGIKTNNILDALYFTVVTMTCVGYGDLVPETTLTILLACLFVVLGMLIVGLVLSKAADLLVEKQERLLVKALHLNESIDEAEILKDIKTKKVRNKCIILVVFLLVLMAAGTGILLSVEDLDFVHAFYCVVGSLTGLGYIDKCFSTKEGRVFALFWILSGTIYLAQLLFTFALLRTEGRQRSLVKWVLKEKQRLLTLRQLILITMELSSAEFIVYKLKEMGKINEDDIAPIMDEFETLDYDKTGTLSVSDLLYSQSSLMASDVLEKQISV